MKFSFATFLHKIISIHIIGVKQINQNLNICPVNLSKIRLDRLKQAMGGGKTHFWGRGTIADVVTRAFSNMLTAAQKKKNVCIGECQTRCLFARIFKSLPLCLSSEVTNLMLLCRCCLLRQCTKSSAQLRASNRFSNGFSGYSQSCGQNFSRNGKAVGRV